MASSLQTERARDLGIPFTGEPGPLNAITDVSGVEVGFTTLIQGDDVRTGVTAVLPRGKHSGDPVYAGWFWLNGNGEMTGTAWVEESGFLEGPAMITNTHSVGLVRDTVVAWLAGAGKMFQPWANPLVAETYDGFLNDINGFHIQPEHVVDALENAAAGPVTEGNIGGGTGMICYQFKGGTGAASRRLAEADGGFTLGALVQANFGARQQLTIAGRPVGRLLGDAPLPGFRGGGEAGSLIGLIATDAPLLPHQLKRLARRAALGMARTGGLAGNGSGDLFLAFSTANPGAARPAGGIAQLQALDNARMDALLSSAAYAVEEAIINALVAAQTMTGRDGHTVQAIPKDRLRQIFSEA